jgi:hypothetical protein
MRRKAFITSILLNQFTLVNAQYKYGLIIYDIKYANENLKAKTVIFKNKFCD